MTDGAGAPEQAPAVSGDSEDGAALPIRSRAADEKFNILVVDDREENLVAFESVLADLGQNVVCVGSARAALSEVLRREFVLILLDINMPDADGFETAAMIRTRRKLEGVPIIFMTAGTPQETQLARGYSLGAVDYIYTPVVPEILRAKVSAFLDMARRTERLRQREEDLRRLAEERAALAEQRLQSLLERLDVGVFRASMAGQLLEANPAFLRLLRCEDAQAARLACAALHDGIGRSLLGAPEGGESREEVAVPLEGTPTWISLSKAATSGPGGQRWVEGIAVDSTARREAAEKLREANEALLRTNADLAQFAHAASHDLQEPLRAMSLYSEILRDDHAAALPAEAHELLGKIVRGAGRMERMLRGLLEYSRIGTTPPAADTTDARTALEDAVDNLREAIRDSGAEVTHGDLPWVRAHWPQLVQVFQNLIGNAIKYRGGDAPRIHVQAERSGEDWQISVSDNGLGMDPAFASRAFQLFTRLHGKELPGEGVGLALCQRIVESAGGRLWVETRPGKGSTFFFTLPA